MRGHTDPETLAEFREGLLPRRRAQQVTAHLAECPDCARLDAQLADMPAVLASTPAPPMPAALTARIEAALAAEAAARAAGAGADTAVPGTAVANGATAGAAADTPAPSAAAPSAPAGGTVSPDAPAPGSAAPRAPASRTRAPRPRRPAPRAPAGRPGSRTRAPGRSRMLLGFAAATATIVVIGGGGYGLSQLFANNESTSSATSSGAGAASAPRSAAQGGATSGHYAATEPEGAPAKGVRQPGLVHSGINYQAAGLGHQVAVAMSKFSPAQPPPALPNTGKPLRTRPSIAQLGLPACVTSLVAGQRPLFVDEARYRDRTAVIFVVPGKGNTLRVLVAAADCSGPTGHLLASTTLPR